MAVAHLNNETFKEMTSEGIALIDFWAEWCMPCQALLPVIEELGQSLEGVAKVGKVNCDENRELVKEFRVMSIPTVIFSCLLVRRHTIMSCSSGLMATSCIMSSNMEGSALSKSSLKGATNTPAMSAAPGLIVSLSSPSA